VRRLRAIGFAAKESSDVDDSHDYSVANPIAGAGLIAMLKALVRRRVVPRHHRLHRRPSLELVASRRDHLRGA
jgi:hypothetical protein